MSIVFDFAAINRRLNRKPEPVAVNMPFERLPQYDDRQAPAINGRPYRLSPRADEQECIYNYRRELVDEPALRSWLDNHETVFLGWDTPVSD